MDDSPTRRGQPAWFRRPDVQLIAINDSFLLESMVFTFLKNHFGDETYYLDLVELFLDVIQKTEVGQLLDLTSQPMDHDTKKPKMDLSRFTLQRYQQIVKFKTAYYTFYLPVAIGMITSGVRSKEAFDLAESICLQMGEVRMKLSYICVVVMGRDGLICFFSFLALLHHSIFRSKTTIWIALATLKSLERYVTSCLAVTHYTLSLIYCTTFIHHPLRLEQISKTTSALGLSSRHWTERRLPNESYWRTITECGTMVK
jgi:hypothetical protein